MLRDAILDLQLVARMRGMLGDQNKEQSFKKEFIYLNLGGNEPHMTGATAQIHVVLSNTS